MTAVLAVAPLLADGPGESPFLTIVESAARAAAILVADAGSWWRVPSTSLLQPAVLGAHTALRPLLLLVLMVSVLVQAIRLILMRRSEPLLSVAGGLLRFAVAAALGITVLQGALWAGDLLATTLLGSGGTPAEGGEFGGLMRDALTSRRGGMAEPFLLLLVSVVVLLLAAAQWMAMALRQVALLVVAATLPLAAAGSLTAATRGWLSRMLPWALALVLYKPAAALVHAVGLQYLKQLSDGNPVSTALAGVVVLALGVAALPALLRLLSFTSVRIADGGWSDAPHRVRRPRWARCGSAHAARCPPRCSWPAIWRTPARAAPAGWPTARARSCPASRHRYPVNRWSPGSPARSPGSART